MEREDTRSGLGTVRIHKDVIASIALLAAAEIPGVKSVGAKFSSKILELLGRKPVSGIRVEINKNEEVKVEMPLVAKYGFNIPDVADKVQESVRAALEKMTNLSIKDININVIGIERG
jgi:uncharacterized alkaline shock family protein YloU